MKKIFVVVLVVAAIFAIGISAYLKLTSRWLVYENSRYGFSVNYPSGWVLGEAPTNNDGREFTSPDKSIACRAYGFNNVLPGESGDSQTLAEYVAWLTSGGVIGGVQNIKDTEMAGYSAKELLGNGETGVSQAVYILGNESGRGLVCHYYSLEARESFAESFEKMKKSFKLSGAGRL